MEKIENLKEKIIELLLNESYTGLDVNGICESLGIDDSESFKLVVKILNELEDNSVVVLSKKGKYFHIDNGPYHLGVIDLKDKGFGFIKSKGFEEDFYVSKSDTLDSNNSDTVIFRIKDEATDQRREAVIVKVVSRGLKTAVGEVTNHKGKYYLKNIEFNNKIEIVLENLSYAVVGDMVKCNITHFKNGTFAFADVCEVLGNKHDVGMDITSVAVKNDFKLKFDDQTIEEVKNINVDFEKEKQRRVDYTKDLIITIDGDDAKDLDDAISCVALDNGSFLLGVYIADVSYYVRENTSLDKEAYERGTSVYLTDRVIPMLPHKLCNDLCSLNEKEEKLVIACIMEIDKYGKVVSSTINEGIIKSTHRMTYNNCNKMLEENDVDLIDKYSDIYSMLIDMRKLASNLHKMRHQRGSLDFDIPESKIVCDENGTPIDVVLRTRGVSEKMIEEFMLIANETVASTINHLELPFVYRVHDSVNLMKLKDLSTMFNIAGYKLVVRNKIYTKEIQKLLEEIKDEDSFLKTMLLRMMAKAIYSIENIGHFGLASTCYTHFTSPIRRYPDLIVHRLLRKYLFDYSVNASDIESLTDKLDDICTHSSLKERDAIECEYEVDDMKKAEYMEKYIGSIFEGVITSVTSFGIFVSLPNTIEGLIHVSDLDDDYYEFIPSLKILIGQRTKRKLKLGDKIKIKVTKASKKMREINFKMVYNREKREKDDKKEFPRKHRQSYSRDKRDFSKSSKQKKSFNKRKK